jgi:hypothetical protein
LENLGGFVGATLAVFVETDAFFAAGGSFIGLFAAILRVSAFFGSASIVSRDENGKSRPARAVAINLLHAHPHRGGHKGGYPKPSERFFCAGRHYSCGFADLGIRGFGDSQSGFQKTCCKCKFEKLDDQHAGMGLQGVCKSRQEGCYCDV